VAKTYYRTIWISDMHLCSRDCRADSLLSFLKRHKCEYLYLVGDFIDIWQLKRRWYWPQTYNNIIHKILGRAKKGTKVIYIPGNHDEMFREFIGQQFGGVEIHQQAIHHLSDGRRLMVLHGDEFDLIVQNNKWLALVGNAAYDNLIYVNRVLNLFRRFFGMPYWSLAAYLKHRVKNAVKYIGSFEQAVVHEAKKKDVHGVVCGHIHQPVVKEVDGLTYCNTGDWVENCTALVEKENGVLEIIHWTKDGQDISHILFEEEDDSEEALMGAQSAAALVGIG